MRYIGYLTAALTIGAAFGGGAALANTCQAGNLTCPTNMPVDGYCQCTAHGSTQDGTVIPSGASRSKSNSTAGGCGSNPGAPGCR